MSPSVRVCCVLYDASAGDLRRLRATVDRAGAVAVRRGSISAMTFRAGDCSAHPMAEPGDGYVFFDDNLGHSAGCNTLASDGDEDLLLFLNPDAVLAPDALDALVRRAREPGAGAVDGRQIPLEHPKAFDPRTGEQSWASGACLLVPRNVFEEVGGFDPHFFWSYCNDVDLSWRIRLTGRRAVHAPDAVVFHDKRLSGEGAVLATRTQDEFSTLGRLHLGCRYDRPDVVEGTLRWVDTHGSPAHRRAAADFRRRRAVGDIPRPIPGAGHVAQFVGGEYARHRF